MRKTAPFLAAMILMAGVASAAPLGLATSSESFTIMRPALAEPTTLSSGVVSQGDSIRTNNAPARIQATSGESYVVGSKSQVSFANPSEVVLNSGELAMSLPAASKAGLRADSLVMTQLSGDAEKPATLVVSYAGENEMIVSALNASFAVTNTTDSNQVAVVGAGEQFKMVKGPLGKWAPYAPFANMQDPSNPNAGVEGGGQPVEGTEEEKERRRRGGWLWWPVAVVGAGAGVGAITYAVVRSRNDRNDQYDRDREDDGDQQEESPIRPVEEDPYNDDQGEDPIDEKPIAR